MAVLCPQSRAKVTFLSDSTLVTEILPVTSWSFSVETFFKDAIEIHKPVSCFLGPVPQVLSALWQSSSLEVPLGFRDLYPD